MNYMDDASTFERSLLQKARQKHIPVTGAQCFCRFAI